MFEPRSPFRHAGTEPEGVGKNEVCRPTLANELRRPSLPARPPARPSDRATARPTDRPTTPHTPPDCPIARSPDRPTGQALDRSPIIRPPSWLPVRPADRPDPSTA